MKTTVTRKILRPAHIAKKIAEMKADMQGYWAIDDWDIRICPHPSVSLLKQKANEIKKIDLIEVKMIFLEIL